MIKYQVSVLSLSQQTLKVRVFIPALSEQLKVTLPAWIPGSYKIRDFAKNLGEFEAASLTGSLLQWQKIDKQTWLVETKNQACELSYTVVANDFSVRGAFMNHDYAFMNTTSVFVDIAQGTHLPRSVVFDSNGVSSSWTPYSSMATTFSANEFECGNYEELIDSPIYWGIAMVQEFEVQGVSFAFLLSGQQPIDINRIVQDVKPICAHHLDLFQSPSPIKSYLFITLLADTGFGGLEHRNSTVLMYPRFDLPLIGESQSNSESNNESISTQRSDSYIDYLSLCSHEFFHTWHVKRLRPEVLLQPDLSKEVYSEQLWIYEGITSYYDDVTVARVGKMSPEHYLTILGRHLTRLYHTPGRHKQTPAESSFDAWTRFYQQDANSNNQIVSYYTKGGIIAMGLDIVLRQQSNGTLSLDDLMCHLWQHYGQNEIGTPDNVISKSCYALGVNIDNYLSKVAFGTEDVDIETLLNAIGLSVHFRTRENASDKGGTVKESQPNDFGALLASAPDGLKVTQIQQDSSAEKAGLQIGDKIIAVNEWLATEALLNRFVQSASSNESLNLSIARQGKLIERPLSIFPAQTKAVYVTVDNKEKYYNWLGL